MTVLSGQQRDRERQTHRERYLERFVLEVAHPEGPLTVVDGQHDRETERDRHTEKGTLSVLFLRLPIQKAL